MRSVTHAVVAFIVITTSALIVLSSPALATMATWVNGDSWSILGDSEIGYCRLNLRYERDDTLAVLAGNLNGGPSMGFSSRNLRPLIRNAEIVEASLRFSNGEYYQLVAEVLGPNLIIANVPVGAVRDFANTTWMEVRVRELLIGTYNLAGTRNMVNELVECVQAMRGQPS